MAFSIIIAVGGKTKKASVVTAVCERSIILWVVEEISCIVEIASNICGLCAENHRFNDNLSVATVAK